MPNFTEKQQKFIANKAAGVKNWYAPAFVDG